MAISLSEKIKTVVKLIFEPKALSALLSMRHSGYLVDIGWFESLTANRPVDKNYKPIPWLTYPFIHFMEGRINSPVSVLEFGSGNSTFYFAERVKRVTSVEHDKGWFTELSSKLPANVKLIYQSSVDIEGYLSILKSGNGEYDVILIDAENRYECLINCLSVLSSDGIVILDDSERWEYSEGINYLIKAGFRKLDFWGISPGYSYLKCTTLFYKDNNCFGL